MYKEREQVETNICSPVLRSGVQAVTPACVGVSNQSITTTLTRPIFRFFLYISVRHRSLTLLIQFFEIQIQTQGDIRIQKLTPRYQRYRESSRKTLCKHFFSNLSINPWGLKNTSLVDFWPNCSFKGMGSHLKVH